MTRTALTALGVGVRRQAPRDPLPRRLRPRRPAGPPRLVPRRRLHAPCLRRARGHAGRHGDDARLARRDRRRRDRADHPARPDRSAMSTDRRRVDPTDAMTTADAIPAGDGTPTPCRTDRADRTAEAARRADGRRDPERAPLDRPSRPRRSRKGLALGRARPHASCASPSRSSSSAPAPMRGYQVYLDNRPAPAIPGDPAVVGIADAARRGGARGRHRRRTTPTPSASRSAPTCSPATPRTWSGSGSPASSRCETLGTFDDGDRTATALVILGQTVDGSPFTINLVVIAQGGQIVRLR